MYSPNAKTPLWFTIPACVMIVSAIFLLSTFIHERVGEGTFPWWPYPAFTLLVGWVFWAYHRISVSKGE